MCWPKSFWKNMSWLSVKTTLYITFFPLQCHCLKILQYVNELLIGAVSKVFLTAKFAKKAQWTQNGNSDYQHIAPFALSSRTLL
jgi:hypothetical protein